MDDNRPVLKGHMVIEGDTILYLSEEAPEPLPEGAERINGEGPVFMPGLINTHGHAAMSLLRGYSDDSLTSMAGTENVADGRQIHR